MGKEVEGRGRCKELNAAQARNNAAATAVVGRSRIRGVAFRLGGFQSLDKRFRLVFWWRAFFARQSKLELNRGLFRCGDVGLTNALAKLPL